MSEFAIDEKIVCQFLLPVDLISLFENGMEIAVGNERVVLRSKKLFAQNTSKTDKFCGVSVRDKTHFVTEAVISQKYFQSNRIEDNQSHFGSILAKELYIKGLFVRVDKLFSVCFRHFESHPFYVKSGNANWSIGRIIEQMKTECEYMQYSHHVDHYDSFVNYVKQNRENSDFSTKVKDSIFDRCNDLRLFLTKEKIGVFVYSVYTFMRDNNLLKMKKHDKPFGVPKVRYEYVTVRLSFPPVTALTRCNFTGKTLTKYIFEMTGPEDHRLIWETTSDTESRKLYGKKLHDEFEISFRYLGSTVRSGRFVNRIGNLKVHE